MGAAHRVRTVLWRRGKGAAVVPVTGLLEVIVTVRRPAGDRAGPSPLRLSLSAPISAPTAAALTRSQHGRVQDQCCFQETRVALVQDQ